MKIASWNINVIKARLENLARWLEEANPDIACLQEIKSIDENFPTERFEELGYNVAVHGQKSFNGVAIFSKHPFDEINKGLPGDENDEQARYLEAVISTENGALRVASIYLPNGNPVDSEKYPYKLNWMTRLKTHAQSRLAFEEPLVLAGDYNIIPTEQDVHDAAAWQGDALFRPESHKAYHEILNIGLTSAFEACQTQGIIKKAPGKKTMASALTTCCSPQKHLISLKLARSTNTPEAGKNPPTMCPYG